MVYVSYMAMFDHKMSSLWQDLFQYDRTWPQYDGIHPIFGHTSHIWLYISFFDGFINVAMCSWVSKTCDQATVWSRNFFQRLHKIWVFEPKNAQFTTVLPVFFKVVLMSDPFCLWKTFEPKYWLRQKEYFLKVWCADMHLWTN